MNKEIFELVNELSYFLMLDRRKNALLNYAEELVALRDLVQYGSVTFQYAYIAEIKKFIDYYKNHATIGYETTYLKW